MRMCCCCQSHLHFQVLRLRNPHVIYRGVQEFVKSAKPLSPLIMAPTTRSKARPGNATRLLRPGNYATPQKLRF